MPRGTSRYDETALQQRLWTPKDSGLPIAVWFDASDLSTISYGASGISEWRDKSGNNRHATQATSTAQPILIERGLNNQSVVRFDGSNDNMFFTGSHGQEWSAFLVGRADATNRTFFQFGPSNGNGNIYVEGSEYQARPGTYGALNTATVSPFVTSEDVLLSATFSLSATKTNLYKNGNLGNPANTTSVPAAINLQSNLGNQGTVYWMNGFIAEILVFDAINEVIRLAAEGYLAWKWGLQAKLPAEHSFVLRPPMIGD